MSAAKTSEADILSALTKLFREHGFGGASLTRIAEATGLKRASLYHRFPGGKNEMALAVLRCVHEQFSKDIFAALGQPGELHTRVRQVARRLDEFYEGGRQACLIDAMSLGEQDQEIRDAIAQSLSGCVDAFTAVAREAGHSASVARRLAEDAVSRLQGSLVFGRTLGDTRPFKRLIKELPELLCE